MAIKGTDQRVRVTDFSSDGNSSVVAVDAAARAPTPTVPSSFPGISSGIQIGDNFFLTAGHSVFDDGSGLTSAAGRVTAGPSVIGLPARGTTPLTNTDINFSAASITYPDDYPNFPLLPFLGNFDQDIALIQTTGPVGATNIGMLVYINPEDIVGQTVTTTGFPGVFDDPNTRTATPQDTVAAALGVSDLNIGTWAYTSSGEVRDAGSDGQFAYTNTMDTEAGQSGSGVWTTIDDGNGQPVTLVVGVHTNSRNGGHLITTNEYRNITDTMEAAAGSGAAASAAALPENVIMGSEPGFFSFFTGSGDDYIQGNYRREVIFGRDGDDRMEGGGADDRLFGGEGVDQALYSGLFTEYDFTINDPNVPEFTFTHARGAAANGTDTVREVEFAVFEYEDSDRNGSDDDGNVFFVPLLADDDDPTKLADGPGLTYEVEVRDSTDADAALIGTFSADLPAFTFDGDLDYELTIGAEQSILYNFAYIVDVSGSMRGTNLSQTQAAYEALTNFLISDGIAERSNFAVIPFNSSASLASGVDAQGAIATVNGLSAGGGTSFGPALSVAESWFESLNTVRSATNIAYFLSDGVGSGASTALQVVDETLGLGGVPVDVRAFGIGSGASFSSLNTIDSNSAQFLNNPSDLISAFGSSGISRDTIERIEVLLAGVIIDTIAPTALTDDPLGLRFEGTLEGLDVGRDADNDVVFRLIFNDGTPTTELDARVTSGQEEVVEQSDDGTEVRVTFSVNLRDYDATALAESLVLVANDLSNTITLGDPDATVEANGGDDTIIMGSGRAVIDGGDGIDTVRFDTTRDAAGAISRSGDVVSVGSQASLVDVEFIAFTDALVDTQTLQESPIVSLSETAIRIDEGDSGTTEVQFTLSVAQAAASDIVISFATRDGEAEAGTDYSATTGQAIIAAGETEATVTLQVNGDIEFENDEEFFIDFATNGLTLFAGAQTTATGGVLIQTDDSRIDLAVVGDRFSFFEGDEGTTSSPGLSLFRTGAIDLEETVTYNVEGVGPNAADADDFATPLSGTVTFAAGEDSVSLNVAVAGDTTVEAAEAFRIVFEGADGGSSIDQTSNVFTIENDDEESTINEVNGTLPTSGPDNLIGTKNADLIKALGGNDTVCGDGGDDLLRGGAGDDLLKGQAGNDVIKGNVGNDTLKGGKGDDKLVGHAGDDRLFGGSGNDRLVGSDGNDLLNGGSGDNRLIGGSGVDKFVFAENATGTNKINDFDIALDILKFTGISAVAVREAGNKNSIIDLDTGGLIKLLGVSAEEAELLL